MAPSCSQSCVTDTPHFPIYFSLDDAAGTVSCSDRGLQYGDGLFETMLWDRRFGIQLQGMHWRRLQASAQHLCIPCPMDKVNGLLDRAQAFARQYLSEQQLVFKLTLTRGSGGRGYQLPKPVIPRFWIAIFPMHAREKVGYRCHLERSHVPVSINPFLAGLKHLNRLDQVMARSRCRDIESVDVLMSDDVGHVIECSSYNVFAVSRDEVLTPSLQRAGVAGVMRSVLLEEIFPALGLCAREVDLSWQEFKRADEVFIGNSVYGVRSVVSVEEHLFASSVQFKRVYNALVERYAGFAC